MKLLLLFLSTALAAKTTPATKTTPVTPVAPTSRLLDRLHDFNDRINDTPMPVAQVLDQLGDLLRPPQRDPAFTASGILERIGGLLNQGEGSRNTKRLLGDIGRLIDADEKAARDKADDMKDGVLSAIKSLVAGVKRKAGRVDERESVPANATASEGCPTTPLLTKCCGKILVPQATEHCCGNIPVAKAIHENRCCRNAAGVYLPLLNVNLCCNGLPYPKATMKCCRTNKGNRPYPLNTPCPSL